MGESTDRSARRLAADLRNSGVRIAEVARILRESYPGIGARLAMRLARGWTQQQAADEWMRFFGEPKAAKQFSYYENWPDGGHAPSLETLDKMAQLYGCSVGDLVSDLRDHGEAGQPQPPYEPGSADGHRMAAFAATTTLDLLSAGRDRDDLAARLRSTRIFPAGMDAPTLDGLEAATLGYRLAYRSASARSLLGPVQGTLSLVLELAPDAGHGQRNRVVSLIGQLSAVVGTILMFDVGDFDGAGRYMSVSARAAKQIDDADLLALTFGCRAFHAAYDGNPAGGMAFADAALDVAAGGITSQLHAWLCAVASEMQATAQQPDVCERLLEAGAAHLADVEDGEPWLGIGVFNADKLVAYRGGDLVRLGCFAEAQVELHAALDRLDPSLKKHRATACIDLAEAYVFNGQLDDGVDFGLAALDIVAGTRHAASLQRVESLHAGIVASGARCARQLGERLMDLKAIA